MVELARDRAPWAGMVQAKAEALPFADQTFTALAMSIRLLLLWRSDRRALRVSTRAAPGWAPRDLHHGTGVARYPGRPGATREPRPLLRRPRTHGPGAASWSR